MKIKTTAIAILLIFTSINIFGQSKYFSKEKYQKGNESILYRLSYPQNYDENNKETYPLIIFLHGAGERGNDNEIQLTHIDKIFEDDEFRKKYPCFIIVPQCPAKKRWVEVDWGLKKHTQPKDMSISLKLTMNLFLEMISKYNIDTQRIYVVGLSMGGYGTWDLLTRFPYMFAAGIPICGGGDENVAKKMVNVPVWAFHGTQDKVVPVERSRNMVEAIIENGGNPKYTEYPNKGHLVWNTVFRTQAVWEWLFAQKKQ